MRQSNNSFDEPAKIIKRADAPEEVVYSLTFSEAFQNFFRRRFSKENIKRIFRDNFPQKKDNKKEIIRKSVRSVSFVLLMCGLFYFVFYYYGYRERIALFNSLESEIEQLEHADSLPEAEVRKMWEDMKKKYPDVEFPEGMLLKFANLYAMNQDAVGVLRIPEKELWVPLLQSSPSSPDYYLWKDIHKKYNRYGNPFVDANSEISKDGFGKNTIIYGHNTHDKLGFNILTEYMTLEGYKEAPVITVDTLYGETKWKIFAVMLTNSTSAADRGYLFRYLVTDFSSDGEFMGIVNGINERSMIKTGVDVKKSDKILMLYTCYQDIFDGGRLVVCARLVRDGESADVNVSKAYYNSAARYPQAYYDQKGIENPYEDLTESVAEEETTGIETETSVEEPEETLVSEEVNETTTAKQDTPSENEGNTEEPTSEKKNEGNEEAPAENAG